MKDIKLSTYVREGDDKVKYIRYISLYYNIVFNNNSNDYNVIFDVDGFDWIKDLTIDQAWKLLQSNVCGDAIQYKIPSFIEKMRDNTSDKNNEQEQKDNHEKAKKNEQQNANKPAKQQATSTTHNVLEQQFNEVIQAQQQQNFVANTLSNINHTRAILESFIIFSKPHTDSEIEVLGDRLINNDKMSKWLSSINISQCTWQEVDIDYYVNRVKNVLPTMLAFKTIRIDGGTTIIFIDMISRKVASYDYKVHHEHQHKNGKCNCDHHH